jgi:lysophospholipase L1-like esterase
MRATRRVRTTIAGALAVTSLLGATALPASAAPDKTGEAATTAAPVYKKYVALGDSYTAGPLIPWNSTWCFRSNNNYPSWLATDLGLYYEDDAFTDVSCSSADTTNLTQSQPTPSPEYNMATQSPQLDALTLDTDLVTLGMGGNDYSVFGSLIGCGDYRDQDPTGTPCRDHYTVRGVDTLSAALDNTGRNLERSVDLIKERAPGAKVVLVGYPRVLPPTGYCPDVVPFADGDYAWFDSLNRKLNTVMKRAATETGATYVDIYGPSLGHDACAGDAAWVRGQSTNYLGGYAYHPNAAGMRATSKIVLEVLGEQSGAGTTAPKTRPNNARGDREQQRWLRQHPDAVLPTGDDAPTGAR